MLAVKDEQMKYGGTQTLHGSISQMVFLGTLAPPEVLKEEVTWSNKLGKAEFSGVTPFPYSSTH